LLTVIIKLTFQRKAWASCLLAEAARGAQVCNLQVNQLG